MKIGVVIHKHTIASGAFALIEILVAANRLHKKSAFELQFVSVETGTQPVCIGGGILNSTIKVEHKLSDGEFDALVLPGFWDRYGANSDHFLNEYESLIAAIKSLSPLTPIWGYCSSVCILAAADRLYKKKATATWWLGKELQQRYQTVHWQFDQSLVVDEPLGTASGANGYLAIARQLVEQYYCADTWRDLCDLLLLPSASVHNEPFSAFRFTNDLSPCLQKLYRLARKTAASELSAEMASKSLDRSSRTLTREVRSELDTSLMKYLSTIKLMQASELLKNSDKTVETISNELGFSDPTSFGRAFRRETHFTPVEYRRTFGV